MKTTTRTHGHVILQNQRLLDVITHIIEQDSSIVTDLANEMLPIYMMQLNEKCR